MNFACLRGFLALLPCSLALAQTTPTPRPRIDLRGSQIGGPAQEQTADQEWFQKMNNWKRDADGKRAEWLKALQDWRRDQLAAIAYKDSEYTRPELLWTQRNFVQPQAMVEDRYLYDPVARRYTVDRYLDDLEARYGGIDSVLLWPVYPNIGIDNRNQWDLPRDLPGGVPAIRAMIEDFHRRGVRVFLPTMPWDTGSRDPGTSQPEATAALFKELGADGVNGDTCDGLPLSYRQALDALHLPVALEPELSMRDDTMLAFNQQSWAYWEFPFVPMVSKWKWLEPRHMINVCDRWATDKTDVLQAAFFNGVGVESWENIWGFWNGITPRDAEAIRRIAGIYRAFPEWVVSKKWIPHVRTERYGVYASEFPGEGSSLWTLVNRNAYDISEEVLAVEHRPGRTYWNLWDGTQLTPRLKEGRAILGLKLEPRGFAAVFALEEGVDPARLKKYLEGLEEAKRPLLQTLSAEWKFLPQTFVEIPHTTADSNAPRGMVKIPAGTFTFAVHGIEIEGENREGLDVQYPWENSPRRTHLHRMEITSFFMDQHPVTNAEFKAFVDATSYHPTDDHHFLEHWVNGAPVPGDENRPVVWVSLEDARAFAAWAGKRLPHEWEWQYAAQGTDGRRYPWGNEWDDSRVPTPAKGRTLPPPALVSAHPQGASPFGVEDLVGNVWQFTDEVIDDHTRAAILRGGSFYQPQNSFWYFPQAYRLDEHGKYLLMAPSKDRAGTLGFRCVKDAF